MMKSISLGSLINRKKTIFLLIMVILLEIAICFSPLGKYVLFNLFFLVLLLGLTISLAMDENWIFKADYVEITRKMSFKNSIRLFFTSLIKNNHDQIYQKIYYHDIEKVALIYKPVTTHGPLNTLGDNFYIKIKQNNGNIYSFDLRLVYSNETKILAIMKILQEHHVDISSNKNILKLLNSNTNLYQYFRNV